MPFLPDAAPSGFHLGHHHHHPSNIPATSIATPATPTPILTPAGYGVAADTPVATVTPTPTRTSLQSRSASAQGSVTGGAGVGGTTCTVTDLEAATASASSCSNLLLQDVTISASSGLSLTAPSNGALLFAGTMTVEYTPDASYTPIVIKAKDSKVAGLAGAVIDGQGAKYWDGEGSNGGSDKPDHFFKLSSWERSSLSQLTVRNWPTHLFSVSGSDVSISDLLLDNKDGASLGHNTDAFDVSSVDGLRVSAVTVYNQDDCVAVNSGSNMVFEGLYCDGGHGLSIGSIKSDVTVSNVTFRDSSVVNSANGCRIKTTAGESGSTVTGITYENIALSNITDYAVDVQQDYENGSPTGEPTTGITVSDVTFDNVTGTTGGDDAYKYYVLCGSTESCKNFTWTGFDVTGGKTKCEPSSSLCP